MWRATLDCFNLGCARPGSVRHYGRLQSEARISRRRCNATARVKLALQIVAQETRPECLADEVVFVLDMHGVFFTEILDTALGQDERALRGDIT